MSDHRPRTTKPEAVVVAPILALLLVACDAVGPRVEEPMLVVRATGFVLEPTDTSRVGFIWTDGSTVFESPPVRFPAPPASGVWTARQPSVASFEQPGLLRAASEGFTFAVISYGGLTDSARVTVTAELLTKADYTEVAAGATHGCALTTDGSAWCWGGNWYGELGTGSRRRHTAFVSPFRVAATERFTRIVAGNAYSCALTSDGRAFCWGNRGGAGSPSLNSPAPTSVATSVRLASLAAGADHTCGLTDSGDAYCWGSNDAGQLGTGDRNPSAVPVRVATEIPLAEIAAGSTHTCAITRDQRALCWGDNAYGQLGVGDALLVRSLLPIQVTGNTSWSKISAGTLFTCALSSQRTAHCWGDNLRGQLGSGDLSPSNSPRAVSGGTEFSEIRAGTRHTCAVDASGQAACWGDNVWGQLGNGVVVGQAVGVDDPYVQLRPALVNGGLSFDRLAVGAEFSCGRARSGEAYCWGANDHGQLGIGRRRFPRGRDYEIELALETEPVRVRRP